jgi:hypothetical protein
MTRNGLPPPAAAPGPHAGARLPTGLGNGTPPRPRWSLRWSLALGLLLGLLAALLGVGTGPSALAALVGLAAGCAVGRYGAGRRRG